MRISNWPDVSNHPKSFRELKLLWIESKMSWCPVAYLIFSIIVLKRPKQDLFVFRSERIIHDCYFKEMFSCWIEFSAKPMPHSVVLPLGSILPLFFLEKIFTANQNEFSALPEEIILKIWICVNTISFSIQSCWQMLQIGQVVTVVSWDCPLISGALKNAFSSTSPKPFWHPT